MKKLLPFITVILLLASCSKGDRAAADMIADKPIVVEAGVDVTATRSGNTSENLNSLGLTVVNPVATEYSYTNIRYEKGEKYFYVAAGQQVPMWQNGIQEITVRAFSPYEEDWTGDCAFAVQTDQSSVEASKASDLLWVQDLVKPGAAVQTGDITYRDGFLNIKLHHKMSKLVVNLRYADEVETGAMAESLKIMYISTACTVNAETGEISAITSPADIFAYREASAPEGYDERFEAIFPPQTAAFKLELLLDNGQDFLYYNSAFEFKTDMAYTLNLAVGKDKVHIADSGITADNWSHIAGGKLETDDE